MSRARRVVQYGSTGMACADSGGVVHWRWLISEAVGSHVKVGWTFTDESCEMGDGTTMIYKVVSWRFDRVTCLSCLSGNEVDLP